MEIDEKHGFAEIHSAAKGAFRMPENRAESDKKSRCEWK
jgi:hypothetical protein